ncbi:AraC family transcriptional regulator [Paenibacillus radicis (ex Gao et al. 2016)]|uniref:AraC family transcriptional regulator n=1 Tax=Paenibacillus radicis (ex Gao et al. 2016) TaxID=1737354 RepID=A0A917GS85_9BACL|nr:AraC family transcriptional regulator [Paenibacillus radicis (ex Gao et al. 2016)]GGG54875.1 AraC family transcriptional regulator [Paenibacillus radicis (ex Gao et al. 2016)]
MYPELRYEKVIYQNPLLALRIWRIDEEERTPEEIQRQTETDWQEKKYVKWHYHKEIELLYIVQGQQTAFCPDEKLILNAGDVAIFGSNEPHTTMPTDLQLSHYVFQVDLQNYWDQSTMNSMKRFSEVLRPLSSLNYICRENPEVRKRIGSLIKEIHDEMERGDEGHDLAVTAMFKQILMLLIRHDHKLCLHYNDNPMLQRMQPILDYVDEHLGAKIAISELCSRINMSYTYFIKQFKLAVGMSFTDFLAYKRIKRAEQLLLTKNLSIAEIAVAVGMSNMGHFYTMFRRYNDCSPGQFKERLGQPFQSS